MAGVHSSAARQQSPTLTVICKATDWSWTCILTNFSEYFLHRTYDLACVFITDCEAIPYDVDDGGA